MPFEMATSVSGRMLTPSNPPLIGVPGGVEVAVTDAAAPFIRKTANTFPTRSTIAIVADTPAA